VEARRGRALVEESREIVVVLDEEDRVVTASRRARELLSGLDEGAVAPAALRQAGTLSIPYEVDGRRETIVYARDSGDMAAYEELRAGFTAAVSHELRTPLARVLALLETATLPGSDVIELVEQAQGEVDQIRELIDDILFLSELESGHEVVGLGTTRIFPIIVEVVESLQEQAARAGVVIEVEADEDASLPMRPRMIRVVVQNLAQNAVRYAGPGAHVTLTLRHEDGGVAFIASDDGVGVLAEDVPRLFERFYRGDRARASRGTGLGLAIVKHVINSAGGTVEAQGARGEGLTIRCFFPGLEVVSSFAWALATACSRRSTSFAKRSSSVEAPASSRVRRFTSAAASFASCLTAASSSRASSRRCSAASLRSRARLSSPRLGRGAFGRPPLSSSKPKPAVSSSCSSRPLSAASRRSGRVAAAWSVPLTRRSVASVGLWPATSSTAPPFSVSRSTSSRSAAAASWSLSGDSPPRTFSWVARSLSPALRSAR